MARKLEFATLKSQWDTTLIDGSLNEFDARSAEFLQLDHAAWPAEHETVFGAGSALDAGAGYAAAGKPCRSAKERPGAGADIVP